jgi:adenosylcobinamide-GDP ribazoletransferase
MRSIIDGLLLSFSYFTVIPTFKKELHIDGKTYASMLFFLPFSGILIICIALYSAFFLSHLFAPLYALFIGAVFYLALYGFLHLEAVADVIDAWVAKYSNKDSYAIMKEPQVGSIGAIGVFCFVLLKIAALVYLMLNESYLLMVCAVLLSRLSIIYNIKLFEFHKDSFFAASLKQSSSLGLIVLSVMVYGILMYYLIDIKSLFILLLVSIITSLCVLKVLKVRFGFLNGDCMGTSLEVTELILLNVALLL